MIVRYYLVLSLKMLSCWVCFGLLLWGVVGWMVWLSCVIGLVVRFVSWLLVFCWLLIL